MTEASQQDLRRRGGRRERRDLRTRPDHAMLPSLTGRLPLTEPMDEEQIERLDNASLGETRGTGVLLLQEGHWRVAQYNLTIPIPNALAGEVVARIRESAQE